MDFHKQVCMLFVHYVLCTHIDRTSSVIVAQAILERIKVAVGCFVIYNPDGLCDSFKPVLSSQTKSVNKVRMFLSLLINNGCVV